VLLDIHRTWGYAAIVANALAGPTIIAESMMMIQVLLGVLLVSAQHYKPPRFHMFYGFVAFITVGLLYSYRYVWRAKGWMELAYGLGGLFIMGLGIRAILQVV
jgi:hypothetical protein